MPWLRTGTVACTLNSTTVTGTGTGFVANARVGDAFLGPDGRWYEVANIASDTALSILPAYLGATVSAGAYALAPMQGYVKDSADQLRTLVNKFGTLAAAASINALAGLTGTAGKFPYFTAGDQMALASLADYALAVNVLPRSGGTLAGALNEAPYLTIASVNGVMDLSGIAANTLSVTGTGSISGLGNLPSGSRRTLIFGAAATLVHGSSLICLNATNIVCGQGDTAEVLSLGGSQWQVLRFQKFASTGTNANGTWIRYADGTQICWGSSPGATANNAATGGLYFSGLITVGFPAAFSTTPVLTASTTAQTGAQSWVGYPASYGTTAGYLSLISFGSGATATLQWMAVGRWFQ